MTTPASTTKALAIAAAATLLAACGGSGGDGGEKSSTGTLKLSITDSPVDDAREVWVQFRAVEFKPEGGAPVMQELRNSGGALEPQQLNLLALQGGQAAVLVNNVVLPAGRYEWIRLLVDNQTNVRDSYILMKDGSECELRVPSGDESGLKMNRGFTLPADGSVALTVDFDLRKSLHAPPGQQGSGQDCTQGFLMRPVLRLVQDSDVGAIAGTVDLSRRSALDCTRMVYVFADGQNAANSTTPDDFDDLDAEPVVMVQADEVTGAYKATFLPSGNYTVAYTCGVDEPGVDDSLDVPAFAFDPDKQGAVVQPNLITTVNFGPLSPPAP
jgi:hypothetical protein